MDDLDKKILSILQLNATIPLSELSKKIGISVTATWNRIKKLEENGTIISRTAILDNNKINLPIVIFLSVSISSHSEEWINQFKKIIMHYQQIIEVYRLTGSTTDYLLKIVAPSIEEYDQFQQELIKKIEFTKMSSNIALKQLKSSSYLPLDFI